MLQILFLNLYSFFSILEMYDITPRNMWQTLAVTSCLHSILLIKIFVFETHQAIPHNFSQTVPPTAEQAFKYLSLWGLFNFFKNIFIYVYGCFPCVCAHRSTRRGHWILLELQMMVSHHVGAGK